MNIERMNNSIIEKSGFQNVSYVLEEDKMFLISHYKILNGKDKEGLLKCVKVTSNGKIKLVYFTKEMRPLTSMLSYMNFSAFMTVLEKALKAIVGVKKNGFLQLDNLNFSLDRFYVDPEKMDVGLVYFPIINENSDQKEAEKQFKEDMYEYLGSLTIYFSAAFDNVRNLFKDSGKPLEQIAEELKYAASYQKESPVVFKRDQTLTDEVQTANMRIRLVSVENGAAESFILNNQDFVIGKNQETCDGVIKNTMVSRRHCVVTCQGGKYYIEDLDSTNGTKINNERIPSRQKREIKVGDVISFANSHFRVEI